MKDRIADYMLNDLGNTTASTCNNGFGWNCNEKLIRQFADLFGELNYEDGVVIRKVLDEIWDSARNCTECPREGCSCDGYDCKCDCDCCLYG